MTNGTQKRVELAPDDAVRMRRLTEEVSGRLHEMGLIFARTVGMELGPGVVTKFAPVKRVADADAGVFPMPPGPPVDVDIEIFDLPDGTHCCYDYINQVCACPC